jgi:tetratricopeptide (TPR) repeat protein
LREPKVGLKALASYQNPADSRAEALDSAPMWASAAADFKSAAKHVDAPQRWRAAHRFSEGQGQLVSGKHSEAEQSFRASVSLDEKWAVPHVGLSMALAQQKKHEAAIGEAQAAQRLDPDLWIAVAVAARSYVLKGDFAAAIQEYRRALDMAPGTPSILSALALAYHARGLDEPASRFAAQALKADPDMVSARVLLAERALEARDGKLALSHAIRAVSVDPKNATAWLAQGDAYLLLHQRDQARDSLTTALRHYDTRKQRGGPEHRIAIVRAALKQGRLPPPRSFGRASLSKSRSRSHAPPAKPSRRGRSTTKPDDVVGF